ncbi:uncharacterized protein J4E88_000741 [Alternaria novae-zelandiae]|uniref:uncharacterized protein n=1 Tax=Alternaria novae-zelandiae TaxID=430562 RepID=UPI0020C3A802|nr:uncharacterized protein J4E88_000741 [Alternaria novae-zelandiae]KAI4696564.1 hypothetical protein J4E88_000741 [Alternaria novae-zelandiae]
MHPNGTWVSEPLTEDDASPIDSPNTYYPDQYDCPLACVDYANTHSWITYFSMERIQRCKEAMLLEFSISTALDDPQTTPLIRSCTLGGGDDESMIAEVPVENPKKAGDLFRASLQSAPACVLDGIETSHDMQMTTRGDGQERSGDIVGLLMGMGMYFAARDNCDEKFLFARHKDLAVGVHVGDDLAKLTAESALSLLADHVRSNGARTPNQIVVELCGGGRQARNAFGLIIDSTGDLIQVQKAVLGWSNGNCTLPDGQSVVGHLPDVRVVDLHGVNNTINANSTSNVANNNATHVRKRAVPQAGSDGVCATHLIQNGDTCDRLSGQYGVTIGNLEKWNRGKTWAWTECKDMLIGYSMCVSDGLPPMPPPQQAPNEFMRIGYYEAYNHKRPCLRLNARHANVGESYTHIHWAFADINPDNWKPAIRDGSDHWKDFKELRNVKRIVSFGGWAASTEPATYNIIRGAIIDHRDEFARNLAQFAKVEGIDGIDIDWEYPGAPDILVDGRPIGRPSDGLNYLKFLTVLKKELEPGVSVSIAAPASYWYLKAFPIDRIAVVVDYIVYMTYDLHGQWDAGNPNAYDSCPSGRCIRSHGYLAYAEITELITSPGENSSRTFFDKQSRTDVMVYNGDYISYMTPETKDARRAEWKSFNFAGTVDWAVDLQEFTAQEMSILPPRPESGQGCTSGEGITLESGDLCDFTCLYGFCPERVCICYTTGKLLDLPTEKTGLNIVAWDEFNVELNRLCMFACKYNYCPEEICTTPIDGPDESGPHGFGEDFGNGEDPNYYNKTAAKLANDQTCIIYRDPAYNEVSKTQCKPICQDALDEAAEEGRTSNYGCIGFYPMETSIPWERGPGAGSQLIAPGKCLCDNFLLNELADTVLEAMPLIAQISCYVLMSSIKLVIDVGVQFIPVVGKILDIGLDMATTAAQMAAYLYPEEEDPEGAFSWWLSPCGGTDLVPQDIKKAFEILSTVANGVSSFKPPKRMKRHSRKKGDDGNPIDSSRPRRPGGGGSGNGVTKPAKKCRVPAGKSTLRLGEASNTLRKQSCVNGLTRKENMVITSLAFAPNAVPVQFKATCSQENSQACYHYSSVIRNHPSWSTLTCDEENATIKHRLDAKATDVWTYQHNGRGWVKPDDCDRDEYPPAYLLHRNHPAFLKAGVDAQGQMVRVLPADENRRAGRMWKGACFKPPLEDLTNSDFAAKANAAPNKVYAMKKGYQYTEVHVTVTQRPEFTIAAWGHAAAPPNEGLDQNSCWPSNIAAADPGFVLLTYDPWYSNMAPPYNYKKPYVQGANGS